MLINAQDHQIKTQGELLLSQQASIVDLREKVDNAWKSNVLSVLAGIVVTGLIISIAK